jgi:hypothetical protein
MTASTRVVREVRYQMKPKMVASSAILIAVLVAIPMVGGQGETSYSFTLTCPNVSKFAGCPPSPKQFCPQVFLTDIDVGDSLNLEGAGTFDTSAGTVGGGGTFTHLNSDSTVRDTGTWTVAKFESFNGTLLEVLLNFTTAEGNPFAPPPRLLFWGKINTAPEGVTIDYIDGGGFRASVAAPIFSLVESGCVTIKPTQLTTLETSATMQQPAPQATQDLFAAYNIPIAIAMVVIVALLLLVLRARKKKM